HVLDQQGRVEKVSGFRSQVGLRRTLRPSLLARILGRASYAACPMPLEAPVTTAALPARVKAAP
ncbi:MAG TPA: hypothetical protein VFY54_01410, partial [Rubrobacter sp.]|nr:hypothetical protein [Rubrobacter sp.]